VYRKKNVGFKVKFCGRELIPLCHFARGGSSMICATTLMVKRQFGAYGRHLSFFMQ